MDKVKVVLAVLKKYHFWILCLLLIILGMVVWTAASADLTKRYTQRKSQLDSALKSARAIAGETDHPNDTTNKSLAELNVKQRQKVLETWTALYEKQRKQNPWPKPPILSEKFLEHVKSRKPGQEIKRQYREMYQTFIRRYIPTLFEIVDYRHPEEIEDENGNTAGTARRAPRMEMGMGGPSMGRPGRGGADAKNYREVGIVEWDESDRERIEQSFWWQGAPTTVQLRMAQEDIWVYEALLRIIKATNVGATSHYNAAIKRIAALEIGQSAAGAVSSGGPDLMAAVQSGSGAGGMGMGGGPGMGMGGGPGMGMGGGPGMGMGGGPGMGMGGGPGTGDGMDAGMGMGGPVLSLIDQEVLNGRYVDQNKMPLLATSPPPYAEFKMMPIRMSLMMDQRKIPKLLVECANSTMPVEVQRIRINPHEGLGASSGGMGQRGMGGGGGMGGEMGRPGMGGIGMGRGTQTEEVNLQEVPVEIVGIIYIYNPPKLAKVGTGTAAEADQAMPGMPGAPAAPGTPAATMPGPVPTKAENRRRTNESQNEVR